MSVYSADWSNVGDDKYREIRVYDQMAWYNSAQAVADAEACVVAMAAYAGPIAIAWRRTVEDHQFILKCYNSAGEAICATQWRYCPLVGMQWTQCEKLVCIGADARIHIYSAFGNGERLSEISDASFTMGSEASECGIIDARVFATYGNTGLAVLTSKYRLFVVNNVLTPHVWRTPELQRKAQAPSCWAVLSREKSTRIIYVLDADIYVLAQGSADLIKPPLAVAVNSYVAAAASASSQRVALLSDNGRLQVFTSDLKTCLLDASTSNMLSNAKVPRVFWCGNDAIASIVDNNHTLMLHNEASVFYSYSDAPIIEARTECDGLRIVTALRHMFLGKVPHAASEVLKLGSNDPGSKLLSAYEQYKREGRSSSYDILAQLTNSGQLEASAKQCTDAALEMWDADAQQLLLSAASFGRARAAAGGGGADDCDATYHAVCTLRVLNTVRDRYFALPITYAQLIRQTYRMFIERLITRSMWPLAMSVCEIWQPLLGSDESSTVLTQWAMQQIQDHAARWAIGNSSETERLARRIHDKFARYPSASYADLATRAAKLGHKALAAQLIKYEQSAKRKVDILLALEDYSQALLTARDSGNPNIVNSVIVTLLRVEAQHGRKSDVHLLLRRVPQAYQLYKEYVRERRTPQHLLALYKQDDDFEAQAICALEQACNAGAFEVSDRIKHLQEAGKHLRSCGKRYEGAHEQAEALAKLNSIQADMEAEFGESFANRSCRETLQWLYSHGHINRATDMQSKLAVPSAIGYHWRAQAHAEHAQWPALDQLIKSKHISYLTAVEACASKGHNEQARKYAQSLANNHPDKIRALTIAGDITGAAAVAYAQEDSLRLYELRRLAMHAGNQQLARDIEAKMQTLSNR